MLQFRIVDRSFCLRPAVEHFIKTRYAQEYGATLGQLPGLVAVLHDDQSGILCAAGIRLASEGFFSERYLDEPVEEVIAQVTGYAVPRGAIFEVSTLVSQCPRYTADFIQSIIRFGEDAGLSWSFFTLTRRLHRMVGRLGLAPVRLGTADPCRIPDAQQWGRYYLTDPQVFAVRSRRFEATSHAAQPARFAHAALA